MSMSSLRDHDKTQVLSTIGAAIEEGQRPLGLEYDAPTHTSPAGEVRDDGTSLLVLPARYSGNISFRCTNGESWAGDMGYTVDVAGPAKFVSDVLAAASGYFLDSEER